jgi:hypothetical protein
MGHTIFQPYGFQGFDGALAAAIQRARVTQWQFDICDRGLTREQIETLEDKPHFAIADACKLIVI